eukprot:g4592.t1
MGHTPLTRKRHRWMPEVVQAAAREEPWTQTWWAQEAANETNGSLEQLGEVKELPAAGETPKGVHDTPLPSDDAEAAVQVTKVEILKTTSGSLVDADAEVKSDGEDNPPDADETAKGAHDDDSAVEAKDSDAPAKPEPDDETEEVTKVEILKTTSGSLVDAGAEVKSDGEDNPPDADETAKGAHDDDSAEKKKSTPIRPSLMGSTLIDGGTLMLWKSDAACAPSAPQRGALHGLLDDIVKVVRAHVGEATAVVRWQ